MKLICNDSRPVYICDFCGMSTKGALDIVVGGPDGCAAICSDCIERSAMMLPKCKGEQCATPQPTAEPAAAGA